MRNTELLKLAECVVAGLQLLADVAERVVEEAFLHMRRSSDRNDRASPHFPKERRLRFRILVCTVAAWGS
jgi:hypothetical protein